MIKKHSNIKTWPQTICGVYSSNVSVQGFDTSVKSMLMGNVTDEGTFNNMVGTEDGENVPQLYNDALDFPAQAQFDYAAQVNEEYKKASEYYKHDADDNMRHVDTPEPTAAENSAPEQK